MATYSDAWQFGNRVRWHAYEDVSMSAMTARNPAVDYPSFQAFPTGSTTNAYAFSATVDKCLDFATQLPHKYKTGTPLGCHVHWAPETTHAGTVGWLMDYTISNPPIAFGGSDGVVFPSSLQKSVSEAGVGVAFTHQMSDFADIAGTFLQSAVLIARVCRDGDGSVVADTNTGLAFLLSLDCHIEIDTPGSYTELVK